MPRIEINTEGYTARPVGPLLASIMDIQYHEDYNSLPNLKWLRDTANTCVIEVKVLPAGHDREYPCYMAVKLLFDGDGNIDLEKSEGLASVLRFLKAVGYEGGWWADGKWHSHKGDVIENSEIANDLSSAIAALGTNQVYVWISKDLNEATGKHYHNIRHGWLYEPTDKGKEDITSRAKAADEKKAAKTKPGHPAQTPTTPVDSKPTQGPKIIKY